MKNQIRDKAFFIFIFVFYIITPIFYPNLISKNSRALEETDENDVYCTILTIFNQSISCKVNTETIDDEILEGLKTSHYKKFLINNFLQNNNNSSRVEGDDVYYITNSKIGNSIKLGECEEIVRNYYNIAKNKTLYLYIHKYNNPEFKIPIIGMEAFLSDNISFFDYNLQQYYFQDPIITLEICDTIKTTTYAINYILSVDIDDSEIYKYDPDSGYYNNESISALSLYNRKKEFNDKKLSLCQIKTNYTLYNSTSKKVICKGYAIKPNFTKTEELLYKFLLPEIPPTEQALDESTSTSAFIDESNKTNNPNENTYITQDDKIYNQSGLIKNITDFINQLIIINNNTNQTTENVDAVFTGLLKALTDGSLSNLVDHVVNEESSMKIPIDNNMLELSTLEKQSEELTFVDLGDCEEKLRTKYELGDQKLLILKVDHKVTGFKFL